MLSPQFQTTLETFHKVELFRLAVLLVASRPYFVFLFKVGIAAKPAKHFPLVTEIWIDDVTTQSSARFLFPGISRHITHAPLLTDLWRQKRTTAEIRRHFRRHVFDVREKLLV